MIALMDAMIDVQRAQLKAAEEMVSLGRELLAANEKQAAALKANDRAVRGWLGLWGIR